MAERIRFKLSGSLRTRAHAMLIVLWSGLAVALRRLLRGPRLPTWSLFFEASSHYLKALYRAIYRFADIQEGRALLESLKAQVPSLEEVRIEQVATPIRAEWFRINGAMSDRVILYCHGAYAFYAPAERGFIADIVAKTGLPVLAIDYPLTPEHPFPAQLNAAVAAYDWLLEQGYHAADIIPFGTSAGGNLCLSLLVELRDSGRPLPNCATCLSPWTDVSNPGESIDGNESFDTLDRAMVELGAKWFVGAEDARNPRISPLRANLHGLPTMYLQAGEREIFIDMIRSFHERALAHGVDSQLEVWPDMNHGFQAYGDRLPEAVDAMQRLAKFLRQR